MNDSFKTKHLLRWLYAMWVSDSWYTHWELNQKVFYRTRAVVGFDRAMAAIDNKELDI